MAYRRTARILGRLAGRRADILRAARDTAAEQGLAAVQIAPVAERAGIAAGTVYRHFQTKADLMNALLAATGEQDLAAVRSAAGEAPGPLSALAAAILAFAAGAARRPRLVAAMLSERGERIAAGNFAYRTEVIAEFDKAIRAAIDAGHLPLQDPRMGAAAVLGALVECGAGPLSQPGKPEQGALKLAAQSAALLALRALGIPDSRARGLVVQARWPVGEA
jgi:AcrR family transcriptional regulator